MVSSRKYVCVTTLVTLSILASVALFNYIVDPFGVYHLGEKWDWIKSRPAIPNYPCLHKAYAVEKAKADVLFLGNSRVGYGINPNHPEWFANAYNLGIMGCNTYDCLRYLQHATAAHVPKTVVIGIDLTLFNPTRTIAMDFSEDRLLVQRDGTPTPRRFLADWALTLLSINALKGSFETVLAPGDVPCTYEAGFESAARLQHRSNLKGSEVVAFNTAYLKKKLFPFRDKDGHSPGLEDFNDILAFCSKNNIRLIVFFNPVHAARLDMCTEDWDNYTDWVRSIVTAMNTAKGLRSELWDFTGFNSISTEPFPKPTDGVSSMQYYWEASHYRSGVGDMILEHIFGSRESDQYGRLVTAQNSELNLDRLKSEKEAWRKLGHATQVVRVP